MFLNVPITNRTCDLPCQALARGPLAGAFAFVEVGLLHQFIVGDGNFRKPASRVNVPYRTENTMTRRRNKISRYEFYLLCRIGLDLETLKDVMNSVSGFFSGCEGLFRQLRFSRTIPLILAMTLTRRAKQWRKRVRELLRI